MFLLIVAVFPFASTAQEYYRKNKIIIKTIIIQLLVKVSQ